MMERLKPTTKTWILLCESNNCITLFHTYCNYTCMIKKMQHKEIKHIFPIDILGFKAGEKETIKTKICEM